MDRYEFQPMLNEALLQGQSAEHSISTGINLNNRRRRESEIDVKTALAAPAGARDYLGVIGMCFPQSLGGSLFSLDFEK